MLNATLAATLTVLKAAMRTNLTVGTADDAILYQAIETQQEWFASVYDWNVLRDEWQVANIAAGSGGRFSAFPTADVNGVTAEINFDRPLVASVKFSSKWRELGYGIGLNEYNTYNSEVDEAQDPIMRWGYKKGDTTKFEIWPLGASPQTVRFVGQRKVNSLRTSGSFVTTKTLDLDNRLIAYAVAVDMLTGREDPGAKSVQEKLNALWQVLRSSESKTTSSFTVGEGARQQQQKRITPITVR